MGSLFARLPDATNEERIDLLVEQTGFRVERIVSRGQRSAEDFWYDQPQDEWVLVLEGRARVELEASGKALDLGRGDWVSLPAHTRHRISWTDPDRDTVWLAVHGSGGS